MARYRIWLTGVGAAIPAVLLLAGGAQHLRNGLSLESAFPVPLYISANTALPIVAYRDAAKALDSASVRDGDARISLAEAKFLGGAKPGDVLSDVRDGIAHTPASAEGWAAYAEITVRTDPHRSAMALDQAFTIAPYDFFWAGRRAQIAAHVWGYLPSDTKDSALRQTRLLWTDPDLRNEIILLLTTSDGSRLLTRAFANDPDTLRNINRWVAARRRELAAQKH